MAMAYHEGSSYFRCAEPYPRTSGFLESTPGSGIRDLLCVNVSFVDFSPDEFARARIIIIDIRHQDGRVDIDSLFDKLKYAKSCQELIISGQIDYGKIASSGILNHLEYFSLRLCFSAEFYKLEQPLIQSKTLKIIKLVFVDQQGINVVRTLNTVLKNNPLVRVVTEGYAKSYLEEYSNWKIYAHGLSDLNASICGLITPQTPWLGGGYADEEDAAGDLATLPNEVLALVSSGMDPDSLLELAWTCRLARNCGLTDYVAYLKYGEGKGWWLWHFREAHLARKLRRHIPKLVGVKFTFSP